MLYCHLVCLTSLAISRITVMLRSQARQVRLRTLMTKVVRVRVLQMMVVLILLTLHAVHQFTANLIPSNRQR